MLTHALLAALIGAAAQPEPVTPQRGKPIEAEHFTLLREAETRQMEGATGGQAVVLARPNAEVAIRFATVPGTHVWRLRVHAEGSGSNSLFVHLDGQQLRYVFAPKKQWGETSFECHISGEAEHTLSFTLRESPGFALDWLQLDAGPIRRLKPLVRDTTLVSDGRGQATVLAPPDKRYDAAVAALVAAVRERSGVALPVRRTAAQPEAERGRGHVVCIGTFNDNLLIRWLRGWSYVHCGPKTPAPGGFVVETVHDPFGLGTNVVVLAGSGPSGAIKAVERFCKLLPDGPALRVGHHVEITEPNRGFPVAPKPDYIAYEKGRMAKWIRTGGERRLAKTAISYGDVYCRGGDQEWAELFRHGLFALQDHMLQRKKLNLGFRDAWLYRLVRTWDCIEELPAFNDADRLRITNYILDLTRDCRKAGYFRKMKPGYIRWNHQTVPALGMLWAGEYFWKHYQLPEAKEWTELAHMCFRPQLSAFKPLEDAQGYQWGTLSQVLTYTHATGDYTYALSNSLRRSVELGWMTLDNFGYAAAFGDHGASPNASHVPGLAGWADWFYADPRLAWVAGDRSHGRAEPKPPVDLLGVASFPLHREVFRMVQEGRVRTPVSTAVALGRTFDKITLRSDFAPRDDYLLLDGYARGHHLHYDGNAIVRYAARGRIWLHDSDYIRAMPKYHNAVTIVRDGSCQPIPPLCRVDTLADMDRTGLVRTAVPEYNGTDWTRSILWAKNDLLLVVDEVTARQPGHYALQCYWRTLGECRVDGQTLRVTQSERPLVSTVTLPDASGGAAVRFDARDAYLLMNLTLDAGEYDVQFRAYASNAASDSLHLDLNGQRALTTGTAIGKFGVASAPLKVDRSGPQVLRVYLRESPGMILDWVRVVPKGKPADAVQVEAEGVRPPEPGPAQHFAVTNLSRDRLKLRADAETGGKYWRWYPYAKPVVQILHEVASVQLDVGQSHRFVNLLQAGPSPRSATRIAEQAVLVDRSPDAEPLLAGVGGLDRPALGTDAVAFMVRPGVVTVANARTLRVDGLPWMAATGPIHVELRLREGAGVLYADADTGIEWRLPGDSGAGLPKSVARGRHVLMFRAGSEAAARALERALSDLARGPAQVARSAVESRHRQIPKLQPQWSANVGSGVLCLAAADLDGDGADDVVASTLAGRVCALKSDGAALWTVQTGGQVRRVAACDLDGDGRPEIVAGSDDCTVYALDHDGKQLWAHELPPYRREPRVVTVFPADLDGDGKQEVIAGGENWHYFAFDAKGRELWRVESVHGSTVGTAADLDGDGKQEVIAGTEYYWWRVIGPDGKLRWGVSHGPHCTAVWAGDLDGDGQGEVVFGSADSKVYLHRPQGRHRTVWEQTLGDEVTDLLAIPGPAAGSKVLVASAESFCVFALDPAGRILWRTPFGDVARCLCTLDCEGQPLIAVGCDDATLHVLDANGVPVARGTAQAAIQDVVTLRRDAGAHALAVGTADGQVAAFAAPRAP